MHTAISCATCTRPLRIPAALLGQTVRCPFCTDAFIAVADPLLDRLAKELGPHAEKIKDLIRAIK